VARITESTVSPLDEYSVQGRSRGVCKGCPGIPLGEKMAGGEYRAEK